jgi:hypothetical protein
MCAETRLACINRGVTTAAHALTAGSGVNLAVDFASFSSSYLLGTSRYLFPNPYAQVKPQIDECAERIAALQRSKL